jgi:hypothetical protein
MRGADELGFLTVCKEFARTSCFNSDYYDRQGGGRV